MKLLSKLCVPLVISVSILSYTTIAQAKSLSPNSNNTLNADTSITMIPSFAGQPPPAGYGYTYSVAPQLSTQLNVVCVDNNSMTYSASDMYEMFSQLGGVTLGKPFKLLFEACIASNSNDTCTNDPSTTFTTPDITISQDSSKNYTITPNSITVQLPTPTNIRQCKLADNWSRVAR